MDIKLTSLIITLLGISILLIHSLNFEPEFSTIAQVEKKQIYDTVKVQGEITNIKTISNETNLLTIKNNTRIINTFADKSFQLKTGQRVQITGKVTEYKSKTQIQANKIKIISS